jgi:hypothetical protein
LKNAIILHRYAKRVRPCRRHAGRVRAGVQGNGQCVAGTIVCVNGDFGKYCVCICTPFATSSPASNAMIASASSMPDETPPPAMRL